MRTRVEELFYALADVSPADRARYFTEHHVDAATRIEVEALLAFDDPGTTSLDRKIGHVAKRALKRFDTSNLNCGPYRLGDLLGRGGMGTVYLAERVDGEIAQRVAVKLLRPGAEDPRWRQRFLSERQILAALSHPNIARLLDAGHREDGQPYLVMEYVEGQPIDAYSTGLSLRQKLALFLKVLAAVGYLHRNLVVHRDLKPANILITNDGQPKLLDFGIAKMLDLTADFTFTGMHMLTPAYASPEQVRGGAVTTAADIYSLGVVLYHLLTGSSPHQFENDSMEAIASVICQGRIAPPSQHNPQIKGDLEMIVMKALRKEPQERYATIEQFAEDLENYLESRPIRARKGDVWYRTRKFVRRYWVPVAGATFAVAGLATGLAIAIHERAMAQRRFLEVRQLANKLFDIDAEVRKVPGNAKARQLIVDTSLDYLRRLSKDAGSDPELALELGNAYLHVARVQGVPISPNLGQADQAEQNLRVAEKLVDSVLAAQPSNRAAILRKAQISHDLMVMAKEKNLNQEILLARTRTLDQWLGKFNAGMGDKALGGDLLVLYLNGADFYRRTHQFDDALRLSRRGAELSRAFGRDSYAGTFYWVSSDISRQRGDLDQALQQITDSVQVLMPKTKEEERGVAMNYILALIKQGRVLGDERGLSLGQREQALNVLQSAFDMADRLAHQDPNDQLSRGHLGLAALELGRILKRFDAAHALSIYDHLLSHMAEIKDSISARRLEVSALAGSSYSLRGLHRMKEARARLDRAFDRLKQLGDYPNEKIESSSEADETLCALAEYEADQGRVDKAVATYERLLEGVLRAQPHPDSNLEDACDLSRIYGALAAMYRRAGQTERAARLEKQRWEIWRGWSTRLPHNRYVQQQLDAFSDREKHGG